MNGRYTAKYRQTPAAFIREENAYDVPPSPVTKYFKKFGSVIKEIS